MATVQRISLAYNSVYVVEDVGGRVLIDTGPDYRGAFDILREALAGRPPELVVATHGHLDHAGLGARWQESGCPVALSVDDLHLASEPQLARPSEMDDFAAFVASTGAPAWLQLQVLAGLEQRRDWAQVAATQSRYPAAGRGGRWPTGFRFEHFAPQRELPPETTQVGAGLVALPCPGHTPGNLVVVHEGEGWLFSGDQLLPEITPTPAIQFRYPADDGAPSGQRFRSLPAFVASLRLVQSRQFVRCFPGHGEPFDDVAGTIAANLAAIEQRTERIAAELNEAGPASLYALCERLYPRALRRRFWQIVSTVQGHFDLLEDTARVQRTGDTYTLIR